jgi:hypothetical protein
MNNCQGSGGCFRAVAPQVELEASVGLYKYTDLRGTAQGDYWVCGLNSWGLPGYTIGTSVTGVCLNISDDGVVEVPGHITTQEVMADTIRARTTEFINIDDNVVITGSLTVNGILESGATVVHNPFWVAGKVSNTGGVLSNLGKYYMTASKTGTGTYQITPPAGQPFSDTNYVVQITCAVDTAHAYARISKAQQLTTSFLLMTYVNGVTADCVFMVSVIA